MAKIEKAPTGEFHSGYGCVIMMAAMGVFGFILWWGWYSLTTMDREIAAVAKDLNVVGLDPADPIAVSFGTRIGTDPTGLERPDLLKIKADRSHSQAIVNGISRIGYMTGGMKARWVDEDIADTLAAQGEAIARLTEVVRQLRAA